MLVLTRKEDESIILETSNGRIEVVLRQIGNGQARVCIQAPEEVKILRAELAQKGK